MRDVRLTKLTVSQCQLVFIKILNIFVYNITLSHMLTNLCQSQDTTNYIRSRIVSGSGTNMDLSVETLQSSVGSSLAHNEFWS